MANWWDADPVASPAPAQASGGNWWDNDPVAGEQPKGIRVTIQPPPQRPPPAQERGGSARDMVETGVGGFIEGIPIVGPVIRRGAEMAAAATDAAFSDRTYDENMRFIDEDRARLKEAHPVIDTASQIAGGVAGMAPAVAAAPAVFGATGSSILARTGAGLVSGAVVGGADSAVRSGGDPLATGIGAVAGAVTGGAAPKVGQLIGKGAQAIANRGADRAVARAAEGAPSSQFLKEQSSQLYSRARDAGLVVKPEAFDQFAGKLAADLKRAGAAASIHPKTAGFVQEVMDRLGRSQSLDDIDALRQLAGDVAGSPDAAERRLGSIIKDGIDDWMERLSPAAVEAGDRSAVGLIRDARNLWGQARRGEVIDKIIRDAEQSATGFEAGLRNGFRALSKNDKALRGFSEVEKRAIRAVAAGTPTERVLRLLGKTAPTGIVSAALSTALGSAALGPGGAIALPAAGYVAKKGADRLTRRAAERAGGIVRMGREAQRALPSPRQVNQEAVGRRASQILLGLTPTIVPDR